MDEAQLATVLEQPTGMTGPIVEVGRRAQAGHPPDADLLGRGAHRQRSSDPEARQPHLADLGVVVEDPRRCQHIADPAVEGEVALGVSHPPKGRKQSHPPQLGGDPLGQLGKARGGRGRSRRRDPMAQHHTREGGAHPAPEDGPRLAVSSSPSDSMTRATGGVDQAR